MFWKTHRKKLLLAAGMAASLLAVFAIVTLQPLDEVSWLVRPSAEEGGIPKSLVVVRSDGSRSEVKIKLNPRKYSEEEREVIFDQIEESIPEWIKGNNGSLSEVSFDLRLPERVNEWGVELIWKSDTPEVISSSGKLVEARKNEEPMAVMLQVTMELQGGVRTLEIPVNVLPAKELSWEERLGQELAQWENEKGGEEKFELPEQFEGETIAFIQPKDRSKQIAVALLPAMAALLFYIKEEKRTKDQKKERQDAIMADYPDLIVKMTVLFQAGMSMRSVWERIAADEKRTGKKPRAIYEEVSFACNSMADGVPETEAYRQFGRRCGTAGCLKLGNMLAGNVRRGTKHLTAMMAEESARAWQLRKHLARRRGEKAGTKMLLPMFMMFGVVLAMVVVPAFYGLM